MSKKYTATVVIRKELSKEIEIPDNLDEDMIESYIDDNCYDLGDLFTAIKFQCDRTLGTNDEIEVSFKVNQEF